MKKGSDIQRSILSQPYLADILLYLNAQGEVMANQLLKVHSNYPKVMTLVLKLQVLGLVNVEEKLTPHRARKISLTKTGKKAAEIVSQFDKLVSEAELASRGTRKKA